MVELGKYQQLSVLRKVEFGVYLGENQDDKNSKEGILLPKKQVPSDINVGDSINVFVYKDSKDRLIATTNKPLITLGELAVLKVVQVTNIGAFLDWGLEKDLLLPFKEQTHRVNEGREYLVRLYIDKSKRLCASMKVYDYLDSFPPYSKDDYVNGIIYDIKEEYGAFVAVDNRFHGLIPNKELFTKVNIGDKINARVVLVKEDGRLDLSLRKHVKDQITIDATVILDKLDSLNGKLPFNDKCDPEVIKEELSLSKGAFKRAVGKLLKEGKIEITEDSIIKK